MQTQGYTWTKAPPPRGALGGRKITQGQKYKSLMNSKHRRLRRDELRRLSVRRWLSPGADNCRMRCAHSPGHLRTFRPPVSQTQTFGDFCIRVGYAQS